MSGLRIMVVDDESLIAMALNDQLEYLGHDVVATASSGQEAVELAQQHQPDMVLMDVYLGDGIDGLDAAEQINTARSTPIIILTGFPDKALIERGRSRGVVAHLLKPIDMDDLRDAVDTGWEVFRRSSGTGSEPSYHRRPDAKRAPSARAASLANTMVGCTVGGPAKVPKPQSAPAMTFSRPTSCA